MPARVETPRTIPPVPLRKRPPRLHRRHLVLISDEGYPARAWRHPAPPCVLAHDGDGEHNEEKGCGERGHRCGHRPGQEIA